MNVLDQITKYRTARDWTEYQLAEASGLPQSTISSWYRKNLTPTVQSLEKICQAFGITLSQFFSDDDDLFTLTEQQKRLLAYWVLLDDRHREAILGMIEILNKKA